MGLRSGSGLRPVDRELLSRVFSVLPEVERVWLVGSRAATSCRPGSDLDLVVAGVPSERLWRVREALEESRLIYEFDVMADGDWARLTGSAPADAPLYVRHRA